MYDDRELVPCESFEEQRRRQRRWLRNYPQAHVTGDWTNVELGDLDLDDAERCIRDAIDAALRTDGLDEVLERFVTGTVRQRVKRAIGKSGNVKLDDLELAGNLIPDEQAPQQIDPAAPERLRGVHALLLFAELLSDDRPRT